MSHLIRLIVFDIAGITVAEHDQVHAALQHALAQENILITSDHGGKGTRHGGNASEEMTISSRIFSAIEPWLCWL